MDILVVEDDPNLCALWGAVLREQGEAPDLAESEAAARERLLSEGYDLVLLDLSLGDQNGLGLATLAKAKAIAAMEG